MSSSQSTSTDPQPSPKRWNHSPFELSAGCRLHFGLMELSPAAPHCYAGLGVMLEEPRIILRWRGELDSAASVPADHACDADQAEVDVTEHWQRIEHWQANERLAVPPQLVRTYPFHCGLGTGTQLAGLLALARLVVEQSVRPVPDWQPVGDLLGIEDSSALGELSGRGTRSAIGLQGLLAGGLILDHGVSPSSPTQRRTESWPVPTDWRFVLVRPATTSAMTGSRERQLLEVVASRPNAHRQRMWQLAEEISEAARQRDFEPFVGSLQQYLDHAAQLFAPVQGGAFNGPLCQRAADCARAAGLRAVGQSSWGPSLFGLIDSPIAAHEIAREISARNPDWTVTVSAVARQGSLIRRL